MQTPIVEIIAQLVDASGMAALAVFSIWILNRVWNDRVEAEKRHSEEMKRVSDELRDVVVNNTEAMTRLCERIDK